MNRDVILKDIDQVLGEWTDLRSTSKWPDCSDKGEDAGAAMINRLASTIDRLAPLGSHHKRNLERVLVTKGHAFIHLQPLAGALVALRRDYELGHLQSFTELVHAAMFANFIEMAEHLHAHGYKDPAAVIAGSVLEQHLRELSSKNGITIEMNGKPKKADLLNAELAGANIYSKLDQKNVTLWLGLRNEAAHGNYKAYDAPQVRLMIDAVQHFMARFPA